MLPLLPGVSSTPHTTHDTHQPRDASVSPAEGVSDHVLPQEVVRLWDVKPLSDGPHPGPFT